ncbi:MAG: DUF1800 family protein, partial [Bacteroidota bacterium]
MLLSSSLFAQVYTDYLGFGHQQDIRVRSSSNSAITSDHPSLDGFPEEDYLPMGDASRFLAQASYGASWEDLMEVNRLGYEVWLDRQLELSPSLHLPLLDTIWEEVAQIDPEITEDEAGERFFSKAFFRSAWYHRAMTAPDQLRQRMAFAFSEIMVISDLPDELEDSGQGLSDYYDILVRNSLGNYRDLLLEVSLHPTMGFYLSHFNNPRSDPQQNIRPDENYAREVMQLFSIGLYELNLDGSIQLDSARVPIPTYSNEDIKEYAKVFTGLSGYPGFDEEEEEWEREFGLEFIIADHTRPMIMYEAMHEPGEKYLLRGEVVPAGQTGMEDIESAIDNLFHHPNVGPFISRRLIQRLVTSNPTPDYIARVASVFNDNGEGVRGDLSAVAKAILLDGEARDCEHREGNLNRAMLREPILRKLQYCRALEFQPTEDLSVFINPGFRFDWATGQMPLSANSVFNFFLPDYQPNGYLSDLDLYGPVFQIHNSSTAIKYVNEVNRWAFYESPLGFLELPEPESQAPEAGEEGDNVGWALAASETDALWELSATPDGLLDHLDILLTHGQMGLDTR